jgi:hypothetical protein
MKNTILIFICLSLFSCKGLQKDTAGTGENEACGLGDAVANGWDTTNSETAEGTKSGGDTHSCGVSTCKSNFVINSTNLSCDPATLCTLANAVGHGITSITNVASVSGNFSTGCTITTCTAPTVVTPNVSGSSCQ